MGNAIRCRPFSLAKRGLVFLQPGHMARKDHSGIHSLSGPYAAVAKLATSLEAGQMGAFVHWTVVSEMGFHSFFHRLRTPESALLCNNAFFFSGDITSWTENGRLPCMEDCIPPLPPLLVTGRTCSSYAIQTTNLTTTPELFGVKYAPMYAVLQSLSSSGGGPEDRESGCQALHPILLVPGFYATCLASSADPNPFANKPSH